MRSLLFAAFISTSFLAAADSRIVKVLPHLLDSQGRHSLSPSLYERDAYQDRLRKDPSKAKGLRFDVLWKGRSSGSDSLKLRVELRGTKDVVPLVVEAPVKSGFFGRRWSRLFLTPEQFEKVGAVSAWHAVLLDGETQVAELKSFLW
jgi:hypothetical protein